MNNMKPLIKILLTASKVLGSLALLGGMVLGGYKIFYKLTKISETVDYISVEQSFLNEDIQNINDSLTKITVHQKKQDQHMASMEGAARFYIRNQKEMTEEAMGDALETILKKNYGPIVSTERNERSDYVSITGADQAKSNSNLLTR